MIRLSLLDAERPSVVWEFDEGWSFTDYKAALDEFAAIMARQPGLVDVIVHLRPFSQPQRILQMAQYGFRYRRREAEKVVRVIIVGNPRRWQSLYSIYQYIHGDPGITFEFVERYDAIKSSSY